MLGDVTVTLNLHETLFCREAVETFKEIYMLRVMKYISQLMIT